MVLTTEDEKVIEILKGNDKLIFENIDLLAKVYLDRLKKKVNRTCPSCVRVMILTLKNFYKMVNFRFKRPAASYKNAKGDKTTISNSTMTDEKALIFLKTNPERIKLFSEYPSNWKKLIKGEIETEEQKEARIAAEAEAIEAAKQAADAANADLTGKGSENPEGSKETPEQIAEREAAEAVEAVLAAGSGESDAEKEARIAAEKAAEDASKPSEEELKRMGLAELREKYPEVKATSIAAFVDKVLAL